MMGHNMMKRESDKRKMGSTGMMFEEMEKNVDKLMETKIGLRKAKK